MLSLETKNTQKTKIGDSVFEAVNAPWQWLKRYFIFTVTSMGSVIPKEMKYNLHYDEVRGDVLRHLTAGAVK